MQTTSSPEPYDFYPYITRRMLQLFRDGLLTNVTAIDVEPDYGYMARLTYTDGSHRVTYGYNFGLNLASSAELAKDKGYAKFMLRTIGVHCPVGNEFLLPWWYEEIGLPQIARGNPSVRSVEGAPRYIQQHLHYPVYIKPVDGSRGENIYRVLNQQEAQVAFADFELKRIRVAIVEEEINLPDYRIVCLDGALVCAYRRIPLTVIGDGVHTIATLVDDLQRQFAAAGRDTHFKMADSYIQQHMTQHNISSKFVPLAGEAVTLASISNLSAGGMAEDVTDRIHQRWVELARTVAHNFNLRLIGLDLACSDITRGDAEYSVLEVNASPGIDHYASSGDTPRKIVDDLYIKVLNSFPSK